jgi:hypothetical protein
MFRATEIMEQIVQPWELICFAILIGVDTLCFTDVKMRDDRMKIMRVLYIHNQRLAEVL